MMAAGCSVDDGLIDKKRCDEAAADRNQRCVAGYDAVWNAAGECYCHRRGVVATDSKAPAGDTATAATDGNAERRPAGSGDGAGALDSGIEQGAAADARALDAGDASGG